MGEDLEPGRPAVESVFAALVATTFGGVALALGVALAWPPAPVAPGSAAPASALTRTVVAVAVAFAVAQAALPGPRSAGCAGLLIPLVGALTLALRGHDPATVASALIAGVCLTPAAYYLAVRYSSALRGFVRRRPFSALTAGGLIVLLLVLALRLMTRLADRVMIPSL
jgi:hypothetical protein